MPAALPQCAPASCGVAYSTACSLPRGKATASLVSPTETFPSPPPTLIRSAFDTVMAELDRLAPAATDQVRPWLGTLGPSGIPDERFTHRHTFPMLALPWWTEITIRGSVDAAYQRELMASTISGYLFIRLLDDVMDRDPRAVPQLLPLAGLFHTMFERPYHRHFGTESEFWRRFDSAWAESTNAAIGDAAQPGFDERAFQSIAARKLAAVSIPVTAVCFRYGREDLVSNWIELCALICRHEQLFDDMLDWHRDGESGRPSWFLSEARRRCPSNPTRWLVEHGLDWAQSQLGRSRADIRVMARSLECTTTEPWLDDRQALIAELVTELEPGMAALAMIGHAMEPLPVDRMIEGAGSLHNESRPSSFAVLTPQRGVMS